MRIGATAIPTDRNGADDKGKKARRGRLDGVMTIPGGVFGDLDIDGVVTVDGDLEAALLDIDGVFTCTGSIKADTLDCDGIATVEGDLRVRTADIDGVLALKGSKVEADSITCDGVLSVPGQLSADVIEADGFLNAHEIVGDRVSIGSLRKSYVLIKLWRRAKEAVGIDDFSKVDLIEATTVSIQGVHARSVNGHDVTIGRACKVDRVDCTGTLVIDPTAEVGEVVGR
jgi:cytoskeletal protein CcmA (bactofilin family)